MATKVQLSRVIRSLEAILTDRYGMHITITTQDKNVPRAEGNVGEALRAVEHIMIPTSCAS